MAVEEWHESAPHIGQSGFSRRQFVTRALGLGLSAATAGSLVAACSGGGEPEGGGPAEKALVPKGGPKSTPNQDVIYPEGYVGPIASKKATIVKEKVTLKIVVPQSTSVGDWKDNAFSKWYEDKTGVHVEWQVVAGEAGSPDALTKVNAMIASGDVPDAFMNINFSPAQQMLYGSQGMFIPLNELIEDYGAEIKGMFKDYPDVKDLITANDGNIYTMPYVNDCFHCNCGIQRMWINKAWLDKLGLGVPETLDEFEEALKGFANGDPNGNGKKDEVPLSGVSDQPLSNFFMGSFIYNPGPWMDPPWLFLNDSKVDFVANKPEWREGLRYQNRLFSQGLLAKEAFTQDVEALQRVGNSAGDNILGAARVWDWGNFVTVDVEDPKARWRDYVCVPTLKGPDGTATAHWNYYGAAGINGGFVVTSACKNPEVAVAWADGQYELEAQLQAYNGKDWRYAKDGEVGINGKQALWTTIGTWPPDDGLWWGQLGVNYRSSDFRLGEVVDPEKPTFEKPLYEESQKYYNLRQDRSLQLPPVYLTEDQAAVTGELATSIENHVLQHEAKFTMGQLDINDDAAWQKYVDTFDRMGVANYLNAYQAAYEEKYA
ncbi:extracellular solute-binding protein [Actinopolymorpha sp. B17G11]|uniref:extracellular solute-binding protein n=1 Tax=unclassified Actinopolymorpha TaxID=2627063 RepID=UPI0032D8E129